MHSLLVNFAGIAYTHMRRARPQMATATLELLTHGLATPDNTKSKGRKINTHIPAWVKSAAGGRLAIVTGRPSYLSTFTYLPIHIFTLTYIETHRLKKPHTELDVVVATRHVVVLSMCMCVNGKWIGHTQKHTHTQKLKK